MSTKIYIVKAMAFPVVTYECKHWTLKKAEHQRIDDFELWCWRRLLRVPWTARRSNQSILKEISPEYSSEGLILKAKLQYFVHLMQRADLLEQILMLGKIEGRRRRNNRGWDGWVASLTQWTWVWVNSGSWWRTGRPGVLQSMGSQRVGHDWVTEQQQQLFWKLPIIFHYSIPRGQWHQEIYQFEFFSSRHSRKPSFSHGNCLHSSPHAQISLGLSFPVTLGILLFLFLTSPDWSPCCLELGYHSSSFLVYTLTWEITHTSGFMCFSPVGAHNVPLLNHRALIRIACPRQLVQSCHPRTPPHCHLSCALHLFLELLFSWFSISYFDEKGWISDIACLKMSLFCPHIWMVW